MQHWVVVVSMRFGSLQVVNRLACVPVGIAFIYRRNHHLFQSLLYLVVTTSLKTSWIAWLISSLVQGRLEVATPVAKQWYMYSKYVAAIVKASLAGRTEPMSFRYHHQGSMARSASAASSSTTNVSSCASR